MSTAPDEILCLVRRFDEHRDAYRLGDYNETQPDRLVYELYGLSDDEIRLVEEATER